jgi:hypothetical protein
LAFLMFPLMGELQTELRFANPGRAQHHRERPRQEPAAQHDVQIRDAGF